jgi:hypothetical protein
MHIFLIYFKKFSYKIFISCHTNISPPQICMKYVLSILKYNSPYTSKNLLTKYLPTSHMILSTSHMISDDIYPKKLNSASFHTVISYFDSLLFHFSWVDLLLLNTFRWAAKSGRVVVTFIKVKNYMQ